ncbi:hypothetical protein Tco_0882127, partial [Tanacetum coccineum]
VTTSLWEVPKMKKQTMPTESGLTYDPPINPNSKTPVIHDDSDDEVDEAEKEVESSSSKQTKIKNSIQEPPTYLVMKPLPELLEYAFLEKDSLLLVVISALLQDDEKKRIVSILKKHKEAFSWKTSDIPGISPSFCKHKINFEDDAKPVIQRERRFNPNMKEVIKKEIIKLLDAGII